jgi:predicted nucleic acid-binding protein
MKIDRGTKVLVDTNVLLEASDEGRQFHMQAMAVFQTALASGVDLFLGTQVLREYLVVATRPVENNGLGMSIETALENIRRFRRRTSLIAESLSAGELFLEWAGQFGIRGKRLHDLQILATASTAGMNALLTANGRDFPKSSPLAIIPLSEIGL